MDGFIEALHKGVDTINAVVWEGVPEILQGILLALVLVLVFGRALKKHPLGFYIYSSVILVAYTIYGVLEIIIESTGGDGEWLWESPFYNIIIIPDELGLITQLGIGLIVIVMFVGVLPKTELVKRLYSLRTEMSIIGATLLVAHGIARLGTTIYWIKGEWMAESQGFYIIFLLMYGILGPVILALLIHPWITSFGPVRKRMKHKSWKKLQTWFSVPLFIGMLLFGLILNFGWSVCWYPDFLTTPTWEIMDSVAGEGEPLSLGAGTGFAAYLLSFRIYTALLIIYVVLRIRKYTKRREAVAEATAVAAETAAATGDSA
jgi:DMSO/TMAO reductase YedYZ heme-binding membrane subunit